MFNRTTILFISLFVSIIQIFPQTYNLLETIKFATKEKKLAEIKNIKTLPKKEFETVFKIIIEEQDPDLCTELIQNLDNILPVETVLPQIVKLFSAQQIQQHPKLASAIKNYLLQNRDRDYTYSYIKELILSDTTELQIKFYLVKYLDIFQYEKMLPIVKQIYNQQDIIRLAVAKLLASYSDKETKNILIHYLYDEVPEIIEESVRSLITRKEWDVLPMIISLTKNKFCGEQIKQLLHQIDDTAADRYFFQSLPLFKDEEMRKLCIILSSKHKNPDFLPLYLELYKKEKSGQLKQTIAEIIQTYNIPSAEQIFISQLNNKELQELVIPVLIKMRSQSAIPYILDVYFQLSSLLQLQVDNFITTSTNDTLIYNLLVKYKTKNLHLRCLIIKTLLTFDNPLVYSHIEEEIISTKNKQILSAIILALEKVQNWEKKIMFVKMLVNKCYTDTALFSQLLDKIEEIVKTDKQKNFSVLLPELITAIKHPQKNLSDKSFEILRLVCKQSPTSEIKNVYHLIPSLSEELKISVITLLLEHPDLEFLPVLTNIYYKTKNVKLKQKICEYVFKLTNSATHQVIIDALQHGNEELQLYILNLSRGKIKYSELKFFLPLCISKNKTVKQIAASVVSDLLTEKESSYILGFLNDNSPEIKIIGIKTAAKVIPQEFLLYIPKLLSSKNELLRKTTLEQIVNISTDNINIQQIKSIVITTAKYDKSLEVRATALMVLAHWKECSTEALKIYFDSINSYDTKLRSAAEYTFNQILPFCENTDEVFVKGLISDNTRNFFIKKTLELKPKSEKVKNTIKNFILTTKDIDTQKSYLVVLSELLDINDIPILYEFYETNNFILKWWVVENIVKFPLNDKIENLLLLLLKEQQTSLRQKSVEVAQKYISSKKIYDAMLYISTNDTNYSIRSLATKIIKETQIKK